MIGSTGYKFLDGISTSEMLNNHNRNQWLELWETPALIHQDDTYQYHQEIQTPLKSRLHVIEGTKFQHKEDIKLTDFVKSYKNDVKLTDFSKSYKNATKSAEKFKYNRKIIKNCKQYRNSKHKFKYNTW